VRLKTAGTPRSPAALVSFDVDGTLVASTGDQSNKLHKRAFSHAIRAVAGIETGIDVVRHAGGTDPLILKAVLEHHGVPGDAAMALLPELQREMVEFARAQPPGDAAAGIGVLPGVRESLAALSGAPGRVLVCLVTGNFEPIAWLKVGAVGLGPYFAAPRFGGFGSDHCGGDTAEMWRDRAVLVRVAREKAGAVCAELGLPPVARAVHVGDTPADVRAAVEGGAVAVGVCTGVFGRGDLEACLVGQPPGAGHVVLDDMGGLLGALAGMGVDLGAQGGGC